MSSRSIPPLAIIILLSINIALALYATPVTDFGDACSYIELSKNFLGENNGVDMSHRSPLFSMILALIIKGFTIPFAYKVMVFFQYSLVFVTSVLVYSLFERIFNRSLLPITISILFNLSISTIYFANILLTEILTVFFLFISIHFLLNYFDRNKLKYLVFLGLSIGLLSLARFNTVPIIFSFGLLLSHLLFVEQRSSLKKGLVSLIVFFIPYFVVLNAWSLYNLNHNGFYGLFPNGGTLASRNVIVASIRPDNKVKPSFMPVLEIFIKAKDKYANQQITEVNGSFSSLNKIKIIKDLYSGYNIYGLAYPDLARYFKLKDTDGEYQMDNKLKEFYKEIAVENTAFIWKLRLYSLLSSFRASTSGILPSSYGKINLNILPPIIVKLNKLINFFISFFVFVSFFFSLKGLIKCPNKKPAFLLLTLFIIVFSFWGINFVFATAGDANRFKFPAEPIIIGLFVYYLNKTGQRIIGAFHNTTIVNG
jgi:4-amino-4-deoxy-L-arabinose transferase-like glycosyltransferase